MSHRICHVTSLHPADDGRIFYKECVSLSKEYEVYLVAPNAETQVVENVHIVGISMPTINQRIKRWLKLRSILKPLYEIDADVYHFHDPELMPIGIKLKKRGKKIIFDSHEDVPAHFLSKEYIPKAFRKIASRIYEYYEARLLKQYDAVISVTVHIVDRLKRINSNTIQITNFPINDNREVSEKKWNRTVCFAGVLSKYWMLDKVIQALPLADATLYLACFVSNDSTLQDLKKLSGWERVEYLGTISHDKVIDMYNNSSIGLAIESFENPNAGYKDGSFGCTKIPDYMASGLPVIVSDSKVWGGVIRKHNCGLFVKNPNDIKEISSAIKYILDNPREASTMSYNSKKAYENEFNWQSQEKVLFELYRNILSKE